MNYREYNLIGNRYGMIEVIAENGRSKHGDKVWLCKCDCGKEVNEVTSVLTHGKRRSCGCQVGANFKIHGFSKERLHSIWKGIRARCNNESCSKFHRYGGRGITYCKEWEDYTVFREWALNNGYQDNLTIDRIDVNGNYEPNNCRWITIQEQERNKTNTVYMTYKGQTKPLVEWAEIYNINRTTLRHRFIDYKWDAEKCLGKPTKKRGKICELANAELRQYAKENNIFIYQIAPLFGMSVSGFLKKFNKELKYDEKVKVKGIIDGFNSI